MRLFWRRETKEQREEKKRLATARAVLARLEGWTLPLCPECGNRDKQCHHVVYPDDNSPACIITIACAECGWRHPNEKRALQLRQWTTCGYENGGGTWIHLYYL